MGYDITELEEKLIKGEELSDDEYKFIIIAHLHRLKQSEIVLEGGAYFDDILSFYALREVGEMLSDSFQYLTPTCDNYIGSCSLNKIHYEDAVKDSVCALNNVSRLNTLTFLKHAYEVYNYDMLSGELYDGIMEQAGVAYKGFKNNLLEKEINELDASHNKIMKLRNKYFR